MPEKLRQPGAFTTANLCTVKSDCIPIPPTHNHKPPECSDPQVPDKLRQPGSFTTANLCDVDSDTSVLRRGVARVLREQLGVQGLGLETLCMVQVGFLARLAAWRMKA